MPPEKSKGDLGRLTNLDVARAHVGNALAYAKSGDMRTVIVNLEYIEKLLREPNAVNTAHTWGDFQ